MWKEITREEIARILTEFGLEFDDFTVSVFSSGHINMTYRIDISKDGALDSFVLQCINTYVFRAPELMMNNIAKVTEHMSARLTEAGLDPYRKVLHFLKSKSGKNYTYGEEGHFWRCYDLVDNARTYDSVEDLSVLESAGRAFGNFQKLLSDFPMDTLVDTIPHFHNTRRRLRTFFAMVDEDPYHRAQYCQEEIEFFREHRKSACCLIEQLNKGVLPLRVTHNDTKYNNILIDDETKEAICVLDLDTVMPGLAAYDFGDAIRFAACTAAEDERDLSLVKLDLESYEAFTRGFIGGADGFFTEAEIESMAWGALNITIELAARFLEDYLCGDKYFKTHRKDHNLDRARAQIQLARDMEKNFDFMVETVRKYAK
ncbi:MAG: phosphotransferase [Clostridia bacterium]|nr:phosphotransferase [Clostridia bacterium]